MNHDDLVGLIATRFCAPEWAFLESVRNTTGYSNFASTADALAMNLWPTRGLELHGFEAKVSRGDWLREKKSPHKAETIATHCDRWWLVVVDKDIVKEGELPAGWGLMVPFGKTLKVVKNAPHLKAKAMTRGTLASLLRSCVESSVSKATARVEAEKRYQSGKKEAKKSLGERRDEVAALLKQVHDFELASGIKITKYVNGKQLGQAAKFVAEHGVDRIASNIEWAANSLGSAHRDMLEHLEKVKLGLSKSGLARPKEE